MKQKKHKASILVVSLLILLIILATALTIATVANKQRQSSLGAGRSSQAFQNADTGVEVAMNALVNGTAPNLGGLLTGFACAQDPTTHHAVLKSNNGAPYQIEFQLEDSTQATDCSTTPPSTIKNIKSVGSAGSEQRAIQAAVAATNGCQTGKGFGLYVGKSASTKGDLGGYTGVETTVCNNAVPGSHMCSAEEILRSINCGITLPTGKSWISTMKWGYGTTMVTECSGWTSAVNGEQGPIYNSNVGGKPGGPDRDTCDNPYPVLCCSY